MAAETTSGDLNDWTILRIVKGLGGLIMPCGKELCCDLCNWSNEIKNLKWNLFVSHIPLIVFSYSGFRCIIQICKHPFWSLACSLAAHCYIFACGGLLSNTSDSSSFILWKYNVELYIRKHILSIFTDTFFCMRHYCWKQVGTDSQQTKEKSISGLLKQRAKQLTRQWAKSLKKRRHNVPKKGKKNLRWRRF